MRPGFGSAKSRFDLLGVAAFGPTRLLVDRVHIRCCGDGGWRFRPYGESLLSNATKGTKKSRPERPAPRLGSAFLRSGIHPGTLPSGLLRDDLHAACSTASNGAARHSPDEHLHSASRRGGWIKIKSCRRANARPDKWLKAGVRSFAFLWERACSRRRPDSRPISLGFAEVLVGAGLLAKAA
jgi:hypothetical protein